MSAIALAGDLVFDTVKSIEQQYQTALMQHPVTVDLSRISRCDSAGLALLVGWARQAKSTGKTIQYLNPPNQLFLLAELSGLAEWLPFQSTTTKAE